MAARLGDNSYGKAGVRVVKMTRDGAHHDIRDLTVGIFFDGEFEAVHLTGDNSHCLPTDTMKNTVYALAKLEPIGEIEEFGERIVRHFFVDNPFVKRIRVELEEHPWDRIVVGGWPHDHAFTRAGGGARTAFVTGTRDGMVIESGIEDLLILKSGQSAFAGYRADEYTTLRPTNDRILATAVTARWRYADTHDLDFGAAHGAARQAMLDRFAGHDSQSVQHTLYAMGEAMLDAVAEIAEIKLTMPNQHHLLVDLSAFGLENSDEIFVPTSEPYGLIEAVVQRA